MTGLDYYFWINSDWAYLGADRLESLAHRHGVAIRYKPVDMIDVYSRTGGVPLPKRAIERQSYREDELRRWMKRLGIRINVTPRYMCPDGDLASRFTIAADMLGLDVAGLYKAILHAEWCAERDISDRSVLLDVTRGLGLPAERIAAKADEDETLARYRQYTDEAVATGVFGSPTYVLDGERFWGQDRLDFLEEAIQARGRS